MNTNQTITTVNEWNENEYSLIFIVKNVKFHFVGVDCEKQIYVTVFENNIVHTYNAQICNNMKAGYTVADFDKVCKVWAKKWLAF